MFEMTTDQLNEIGGFNTTTEIKQQPVLWLDTLNIYKENLEAIESFLAEARAMGEGRLSVVFTGAGTSDYVGDTKTLDVHVKRVRAKIEEDPGHPKYLTTVRGLGYKIDTPSE